ncbi:MAG TPA: hypothetical protein VJ874_07230, partial [Candidatus Thermoplasmatota archaeon]|nr:hypothetical protein [Candidatus Thermoplasmatota archaeon]
MDFRLVLAVTLCSSPALMAGCADPNGLLTADEAIALALQQSPGATLVGVYGVEGPQMQVELPRLAFRDDGLHDGTFGDGRLSSWVVGMRLNDSLIERRIFGDGRPSVFFEGDAPDVFQDMQVLISTEPHMDSPEATARAMRECGIAPVDGKPTGYLYSFSLYDETVTGLPWWFRAVDAVPFETLGFSRSAELWTVVGIDLAPESDHIATTARMTGIDDVARATCEADIPRSATQVFWASDFWTEPLAKSDAPALYPYPFEVGERAVHVVGYFQVQGHDQTPPGMHPPAGVATPPMGRLTMADGTVLFEGDAWYLVDVEVDGPQVIPGTWLLEARSDGH